MAKEDKQAATTSVAALKKELEKAEKALKALPEKATEQERTELENTVYKLKDELVNVKEAKVKVKFLKSPTGKYNLGYSIGDEAEVLESKATEMAASEWAELVKGK